MFLPYPIAKLGVFILGIGMLSSLMGGCFYVICVWPIFTRTYLKLIRLVLVYVTFRSWFRNFRCFYENPLSIDHVCACYHTIRFSFLNFRCFYDNPLAIHQF